MFGRQMPAAVRHPYRDIVKPGVRFVQSTVRSIDPVARRVVTDAGTFEADVLVVALGADYRSGRHAGAGGRRQRVLHGGGSHRAARRAPALRAGPGHRRRDGKVVQVPARAERSGAAAARLPHRPRAARGDRDLGGDAVRHADSPVARHVAGDSRRLRRARHQVRERQPREGARPGAEGGRAERRDRDAVRSCFSACRCIACRRSSSSPGLPPMPTAGCR